MPGFRNKNRNGEKRGLMNRKRIYTVILVAGLFLLGMGTWLLIGSKSELKIPESASAVYMKVTHRGASVHNYLYVYEDGSVIDIEEIDTRPDLGRQGTRVWRRGKIELEDFTDLIKLFKNNDGLLAENYQFPGYASTDNRTFTGDMDVFLSVNCQGVSRTVTATDYLSPYSDYYTGSYAGMPVPLDGICEKLNKIAIETKEVTRENISSEG